MTHTTTVPIVGIDALKLHLPIRPGNTDLDDKLRQILRIATAQIEAETRRSFDRVERVEYHNTRDNGYLTLDLHGTAETSETYRQLGTRHHIVEQTLYLGTVNVDEGEDITVRYSPTRDFSAADSVVSADFYEVDPENGRVFLRIATIRMVRSVQVTYTGGYAVAQSFRVEPKSTFNPADKGVDVTLSNGDLTASLAVADTGGVRALHSQKANKFFVEFTLSSGQARVGVANSSASLAGTPGADANAWVFDTSDGMIYNSGAGSAYATAVPPGSRIGMAVDMDAGAVWFSVNGVWQGGATVAEVEAGTTDNAAITGLSGLLYPVVGDAGGGLAASVTANFGSTPFDTDVPEGFAAGWGAAFLSEITSLDDPPDDLAMACIAQAIFLWKKMDVENIAARMDSRQGGALRDFLKTSGLTPEAASLLTPYKRILKGTG